MLMNLIGNNQPIGYGRENVYEGAFKNGNKYGFGKYIGSYGCLFKRQYKSGNVMKENLGTVKEIDMAKWLRKQRCI